MVQMYLDDFRDKIGFPDFGMYTLSFTERDISSIYPDIKIVDPAKETAQDLKEILVKKEFTEK